MPSEPPKPSRLESILMRLGTAGALLAMLGRGSRPWMLPLVLVLLLQLLEYLQMWLELEMCKESSKETE